MTLTTPLSGMTCHQQAGTGYLQNKFEVSNHNDYEDMKSSAKCRNLGSLGASAMSPFDGAHTTSYSTLIETMLLSCIVFKI